jgi:hypothetical protein
MDKSETNIKMCEKATEIQNLIPKEAEHETWYLSPKYNLDFKDDETSISTNDKAEFKKGVVYTFADYYAFGEDYWSDGSEWIKLNQFIWLPRQDQLQEMVKSTFPTGILLNNFYQWFRDTGDKMPLLPYDRFFNQSMEQLWLAFVMKGKYSKVWNGEDWIIES